MEEKAADEVGAKGRTCGGTDKAGHTVGDTSGDKGLKMGDTAGNKLGDKVGDRWKTKCRGKVGCSGCDKVGTKRKSVGDKKKETQRQTS